jgi:HK97 family phage major capsid protein
VAILRRIPAGRPPRRGLEQAQAPGSALQAALGANEAVPAEGGFLIPVEFSSVLIGLTGEESELAPLCTQIPLSKGNRAAFPALDEQSRANGSRWGGIVSTWQNEADTLTASKAAFRSSELILGKLTAAVYASEELLGDAPLLDAFMKLAFPLEAAYRLDEAIIRGPGAGQPLGILNSPALITVAKDSGQASGTVSVQNLLNMFGRMLPECRRNGVWLVSTEIEDQLYALATGNTGQAALLFTAADEQAPYGRLMNRPILPLEQCSQIGTFGDIILADPSRYLITSKPLQSAISTHVRFVSGESIFKMVYRVDGQSAVRTPITSYNGGPTKSAFVALEAR